MKKRTAALLGGTAVLMALSAAQAAVPTSQSVRPLSASSYAELLEPVPNALEVLKADNAAPRPAHVQLAGYYYHHHHYHHHHHHHGGGFFPGFAIGALIGGLMAAPPPRPDYYDGYGGRSVEWCLHHYRSYDPESGTYLGYDGYRHPCP
jgi:hypothetical protein